MSQPTDTRDVPVAQPVSVRDRLILAIADRSGPAALQLGALLVFRGRAPSRERIEQHLVDRLPAVPELGLRLDRQALRWVPHPVEVSAHVRTLAVPADLTVSPAQGMNALLDTPLDPAAPLWDVWLLTGTRDSFALCYRAHHAFQDGRAAAETLECLFGHPPQEVFSGRRRAAAAFAQTAPRAGSFSPSVLKDLLPAQQPPAHWPPAGQVGGGTRRAVLATTDLALLHRVTRATGAGTTALTLAALSGTLRAWHPAWASTTPPLNATFALSVRAADDPYRLLGNRGAVATVALPCHQPDPRDRLREVAAEVAHPRLAAVARRHRTLFDRMPYWCARLGLNRSIDARYVPLALADVRVRQALSFEGRPPRAVYPLPVSVPGQPLFIAWTTHRGRLHVTFLGDADVEGLDELPGLWDRAVEELAGVPDDGAATSPSQP
jgi:hypothetical protein